MSLFDAATTRAPFEFYAVGAPNEPVSSATIIEDLLNLVVERNPDHYAIVDGMRQAQ